jgi:recombinational DNA repair protein RecT
VLLAVAKIQMWGLEIGSTAHLVPFGTTCTPVADYKGLAELMVASGVARLVEAHCVYEKEGFRLKRGTTTEIEHQPIADPKQRGAMIGAYAIVHVRGGYPLVEYMAVSDIEAIRQEKSFQWKKGPLPEWYARKTVIRRVAKYVPKNPRLAKILAEIDAEEVIDVPEGLARAMVADDLPSGTASRTLPDDDHHPKALVEGGYDDTPVPPQQFADDPTGEVVDDSGELALDDAKPARRNALREG